MHSAGQTKGPGRLHKLRPEELDVAQRALYDAILGGPRARETRSVALVDEDGCLEGPFNAFLLQPSLGQALQALGAALRYESDLAGRLREIAILVVAAYRGAAFERHAHEPIARSLGLDDEQLLGIQTGDYGHLAVEDEIIARATHEMLDSGSLSDGAYTELRALIGDAQVFELTATVGYYALLALQLQVFSVPRRRAAAAC